VRAREVLVRLHLADQNFQGLLGGRTSRLGRLREYGQGLRGFMYRGLLLLIHMLHCKLRKHCEQSVQTLHVDVMTSASKVVVKPASNFRFHLAVGL
jgi:hypothetical protein